MPLTAAVDSNAVSAQINLNWSGATSATVVRINSEDGTISAVRNADPATLVGGLWIGDDYEVPLDAPFTYRATSPQIPGGELLSPTYTVTANGRSMLKHPGRPALNIPVRVEAGPNLSRPVTQGVFDVLGRSAPVAVSMRRSSARGDLSLVTFDEAERAALLLILDDGSPLLLQTPDGYGIGNVYISIGEVSEERISPLGYEMARRWSLPFITVDRPAGAALAVGNSWADVLAAYPSWQAMQAAEGTWTGVLEGVGS